MTGINDNPQANGHARPSEPAGRGVSTAHRVRSVLAIPAFRRLWGVTLLLSVADWLSLLALSGLVTKLTSGYLAQSFGFSAVVATQLLPGLLFAPVGGLLADRFDRRHVMIVVDLIRCGLFLSIAAVGTWWWLLGANFLIGCTAMMWIPAKDSAIPNLLRRKDQVETATQLGLVMTYGVAVVAAAGLYSLVTGISTTLHLWTAGLGVARIIVMINGLLYLTAAIVVGFRIPEMSGRSHVQADRKKAAEGQPGLLAMFSDGIRFARTTPLIRGLLLGMIGAFAAGGAVIGAAQQYAKSLLGGESTFGILFVALFVGLGVGMVVSPRLARRMSRTRLYGVAIVLAGLALALVALSPHLWFSLIVVAILGACAGVAFLAGITIIGTEVEDAIRGRINALYQSLMKIVLFSAALLVPLLVGLVHSRYWSLLGTHITVDGTRPVLLGAGLLAALAGLLAYRQMGDRSTEPILANLFAAIRQRPRRVKGLLIVIEGDNRPDTSAQARLLVDWLGGGGVQAELAGDAAQEDARLATLLAESALSGARAQALLAAAVRADVIERRVMPALETGGVVVMEWSTEAPLAHHQLLGQFDPSELASLVDLVTGRLRPDVLVLLDRDPPALANNASDGSEQEWRVRRMLVEMAAADPDRHRVVDADGTEAEVADRVRSALLPVLTARGLSLDGLNSPDPSPESVAEPAAPTAPQP
ncbi:MAG TPA: MFS transporter [Pseudonocardiaceae bacterium]|nr:MFS transporter [Pseudonocardiaceae bacterium]